MLSATNFWMGLAGLIFLLVAAFTRRAEIAASRGWDKFIVLGIPFIAGSLAAFAPEHFVGPDFVQGMVPSWMPVRKFWPEFVGFALLAAATSLSLKTCMRLSSALLGVMFALFVCIDYLPAALRHPHDRFGWIYALRDSSFAAGSFALAGTFARGSSPTIAKALITFGRIVLGLAAIYYGYQFLKYPGFGPGVPTELPTPAWVPLPKFWGYLSGVVLVAAGIPIAMNFRGRTAAAWVGALMTVCTVFLYMPMLLKALGGPADGVNEGLNYVADTLLYAGMALVVARAVGSIPKGKSV